MKDEKQQMFDAFDNIRRTSEMTDETAEWVDGIETKLQEMIDGSDRRGPGEYPAQVKMECKPVDKPQRIRVFVERGNSRLYLCFRRKEPMRWWLECVNGGLSTDYLIWLYRHVIGRDVTHPILAEQHAEHAAMGADEWAGWAAEALKKRSHSKSTSAGEIEDEIEIIKTMLLEKNRAYGDSALNPLRLFSNSDETEQLRVRIDDKLSRMWRGHAGIEDTVLDLIGYLVLFQIAIKRQDQEGGGDDRDGIETPA